MTKKMGDSITIVEDLLFALKEIPKETQVYVDIGEDALVEVTDITMVLAKNKNDVNYITLIAQ